MGRGGEGVGRGGVGRGREGLGGSTIVVSVLCATLPHPIAHQQVKPLGVPEWGALLTHYYTMAL